MEVFHASTVLIDTPDIYHSLVSILILVLDFTLQQCMTRQKSMPIDLFVEEKLPL